MECARKFEINWRHNRHWYFINTATRSGTRQRQVFKLNILHSFRTHFKRRKVNAQKVIFNTRTQYIYIYLYNVKVHFCEHFNDCYSFILLNRKHCSSKIKWNLWNWLHKISHGDVAYLKLKHPPFWLQLNLIWIKSADHHWNRVLKRHIIIIRPVLLFLIRFDRLVS